MVPDNFGRRSLTRTEKIAIAIATGFVLLLAITHPQQAPPQSAAPVGFVDERASESTGQPADEPVDKAPTITYEDVVEVIAVPYEKQVLDDPNSPAGTSAISVAGVNGELTKTYRVTLTDGVETSRALLSEIVTVPPVAEVTSVGSYVEPPPPPPAPDTSGCDPNYAGACVPISSDVDCAGGSGNGPAYVQGPVTVIGSDVYDLDRDGDGIACD